MANTVTLTCASADDTLDLGVKLGRIATGGDVITLSGELGAGPTWLSKGIGLGLGIGDWDIVNSPSFTIVNEYEGRLPLFHMDFYRLENEGDAADLGLEEYLYGRGVTVVEWPEHLPGIVPTERLEVKIIFAEGDARRIVLKAHGGPWAERLEKWSTSPYA